MESGQVGRTMTQQADMAERSLTDHLFALSFHFGAIAHDNEAIEQQVSISGPSATVRPTKLGSYLSIDDLSTKFPTPNPITLEGTQSVRKFRSERPADELPPPDKVTIFVALWRVLLDNGTQDGRPIPADEEDDEMQGEPKTGRRGRNSDVLMSVNVNTTNINQKDLEEIRNWFQESSKQMRVTDYSLFVESVIDDE